MSKFEKKLRGLINECSMENKGKGGDTPDFILAKYLSNCLKAFDEAVSERQSWYCEINR